MLAIVNAPQLLAIQNSHLYDVIGIVIQSLAVRKRDVDSIAHPPNIDVERQCYPLRMIFLTRK